MKVHCLLSDVMTSDHLCSVCLTSFDIFVCSLCLTLFCLFSFLCRSLFGIVAVVVVCLFNDFVVVPSFVSLFRVVVIAVDWFFPLSPTLSGTSFCSRRGFYLLSLLLPCIVWEVHPQGMNRGSSLWTLRVLLHAFLPRVFSYAMSTLLDLQLMPQPLSQTGQVGSSHLPVLNGFDFVKSLLIESPDFSITFIGTSHLFRIRWHSVAKDPNGVAST